MPANLPDIGAEMERVRELLRSGDWLTRERVRLVAFAVLIASAAGFLYLVVTTHGGVDFQGRPLGTDFSNVYAAGTYVRDGEPDAPFDLARQHAREQQIFGEATPFYGWHYPPFFLFVAAALALMPYGLALAVWQAVTFGLYLLTVGAILRLDRVSRFPSPRGAGWGQGASPLGSESRTGPLTRLAALRLRGDLSPSAGRGDHLWLLLAVAFPAVLINIGHGQNGFLTAALIGGALVMLDRRPLVAGVLFGLLAYKPQFGLMVPLVLVVSGRWRCFAAAAATVALLVLATTAAFGPQIWHAFFESTRFTRLVALEQGNTGWYKIQSVFSWARMWGASVPLAYALQGVLAAALAAALAAVWRSTAPYALKASTLCLAAILATPYTFDYDMMMLAPAIAFFAADGFARGFAPWEKTALAALWIAPLVARSVTQATLVPFGVLAMLVMFILLLRRTTHDSISPLAFSKSTNKIADDASGTTHGHDIAAFKS
jgi:alpha-1,2-mannosyltransferase